MSAASTIIPKMGDPRQKPPPHHQVPSDDSHSHSHSHNAADFSNGNAANEKVTYVGLPRKGQLALLCIARMADPLAATSIQVYMFYQLRFFDPSASDARISAQAGIIVGAKTAAQVCTGMLWGRLADSPYGGRKVVLLIGLISSGVSCIGYGFSRTFVSAVIWQVFGGAMSSNVGITRCVVAELNPQKRFRVKALLLLPLFASAGMLVGPLIGGLLSSQKGLVTTQHYPYAPPNIFIAAVYAIAAIGIFFGLEETLEGFPHEGSFIRRLWKKLKRLFAGKLADDHSYMAVDTEDSLMSPIVDTPSTLSPDSPSLPSQAPARKPTLGFTQMWTTNVLCTMLSHFVIAGHLGTFTNLWAIFLSGPVERPEAQHPPIHFNGGLGWQPREVGIAMSSLGAVSVILQMAIYPKLSDRFGTIKVWRAALFIFPFSYALAPFLALVASANLGSGGTKGVLVWLAMSFVLILFVIGRTGVTPATTMLINDCTPHPSVRGTIHTTGTVVGNLSRSTFPIIIFAIFGFGQKIGIVGLGFWCLSGLGILAVFASSWVREGSNGKEIDSPRS